MIQLIISLAIILAGVIGLTVVFLRHLRQAAAIDLESLPAEQEAAMKAALMERRLKRKILETKRKMTPFFRGIGLWFQKTGTALKDRVIQMEQHYRRRPLAMTSEQQEEMKQKIKQILQTAQEETTAQEWAEAESKYIEVLSWDPKNLDAYFGLGEVYFARKEFEQAKEIFSYLLKLLQMQENGEDKPSPFSSHVTPVQITEAHYDHALSLQVLNQVAAAREEMQIVVDRDPNNPKYLDKALELSILLGDRSEASELLDRLREVNPDNQKLASLEEQIHEL